MTNKEARIHIGELYGRVREFQSEKLGHMLNPDLHVACEKIPELKQFETDLHKILNEFNERLFEFAESKYPFE